MYTVHNLSETCISQHYSAPDAENKIIRLSEKISFSVLRSVLATVLVLVFELCKASSRSGVQGIESNYPSPKFSLRYGGETVRDTRTEEKGREAPAMNVQKTQRSRQMEFANVCILGNQVIDMSSFAAGV
jgi:hypothetical protein